MWAYSVSMFDQCLYFNTTALARRLEREWADAFRPFALTPPQAFLLRAVLARPGLCPGELADILAIARPTATRALDGLTVKGLVERRPSARDGREATVFATDEAARIGPALNAAAGAITARLKSVLGEDAFAGAVAHVRRVRGALE